MEGLNKIISLVLGLIVVVVIVAIIVGRLNLGKRFASVTKGGLAAAFPSVTPGGPSPSVTPGGPTLTPTKTPTPTTATKPFPTTALPTGTTKGGKIPAKIPKTGPEGLLLIAVAGIGSGILLKRLSA